MFVIFMYDMWQSCDVFFFFSRVLIYLGKHYCKERLNEELTTSPALTLEQFLCPVKMAPSWQSAVKESCRSSVLPSTSRSISDLSSCQSYNRHKQSINVWRVWFLYCFNVKTSLRASHYHKINLDRVIRTPVKRLIIFYITRIKKKLN